MGKEVSSGHKTKNGALQTAPQSERGPDLRQNREEKRARLKDEAGDLRSEGRGG